MGRILRIAISNGWPLICYTRVSLAWDEARGSNRGSIQARVLRIEFGKLKLCDISIRCQRQCLGWLSRWTTTRAIHPKLIRFYVNCSGQWSFNLPFSLHNNNKDLNDLHINYFFFCISSRSNYSSSNVLLFDSRLYWTPPYMWRTIPCAVWQQL